MGVPFCSAWKVCFSVSRSARKQQNGTSLRALSDNQKAPFELTGPRFTGVWPRLVKTQCTCSSGISRVMLVTVGHCFKCDRPLVALAVVSNRGYPSKKAHLFHADTQRVQPPLLRLAIRSRCRRGGFDCMMQKRTGIESITDPANGPERHLTHAGRKGRSNIYDAALLSTGDGT